MRVDKSVVLYLIYQTTNTKTTVYSKSILERRDAHVVASVSYEVEKW